jgi:hypothetical protein
VPKVKNSNRLPVFLGVLTLMAAGLVLIVLLIHNDSKESDRGSGGGRTTTSTAPPRTLADVPGARFISIFVTDATGNLASYMVGGGTEEFDSFTEAIANAEAAPGVSDETFTDLMVISFETNDTLELSYSRSSNRFILDDVLYKPTTDLSPMIAAVEGKFE